MNYPQCERCINFMEDIACEMQSVPLCEILCYNCFMCTCVDWEILMFMNAGCYPDWLIYNYICYGLNLLLVQIFFEPV